MIQVAKTIQIDMAHRLADYPGDCQYVHGHTWHIVAVVGGERLSPIGILCDFAALKRAMQGTVGTLDHSLLLAAADPLCERLLAEKDVPGIRLYIMSVPPTSENIAAWCLQRLRQLGYPAESVTVWETPTSQATVNIGDVPRIQVWMAEDYGGV